MYSKCIYLIIFLLITTNLYGQEFGSGFFDFGSNFADTTWTDTDFFSGPGILGASDISVQISLQTIDASGATLITACVKETDRFCFEFLDSILTLYVDQISMQTWPISVGTIVLLEDGTNLLLEDSSFMLLE